MKRNDLAAYVVVLLTLTLLMLWLMLTSGCAAMLPDEVRPEIAHMSHVTQHQPFTSDPTSYGVNIAELALRWNLPANTFVEVSDGVALNKHYPYGYGEVIGPREQFTARAGYIFRVPK